MKLRSKTAKILVRLIVGEILPASAAKSKKLFGNFQQKHKLIRNIISTETNKIYKTESYFQFLFDVYLF
ncbi:MAG: hypothetical protein ACI9XO_003470 [Paraglaciecola sp.]|jgi:hypothetical protein